MKGNTELLVAVVSLTILVGSLFGAIQLLVMNTVTAVFATL